TDGLAAYWMYQGWGNLDPSAWDKHPLARILNTHRGLGTDALFDLRAAIRPTVEAPAEASETREMIWNYTLPISPLFVVLNGRAERVVGKSPKTSQMLTEGQFRWLQDQLAATDKAGKVAAFGVGGRPGLDASRRGVWPGAGDARRARTSGQYRASDRRPRGTTRHRHRALVRGRELAADAEPRRVNLKGPPGAQVDRVSLRRRSLF